MQGNLLVTPDQLDSTADEFGNAMNQVSSITSEMMTQVNGLGAKWQGDASLAYLNKFKELEETMNKLKTMIQGHVDMLKEFASTYRQSEATNQSAAEELANNILG